MEGFFQNIVWAEIGIATRDTLLMLGGSLLLTIALGIPLGVLLFLTGKGQISQSIGVNRLLGIIVNTLRSIPFVILLIVMIPLTLLLMGTSLGVAGAIPRSSLGPRLFMRGWWKRLCGEIPRSTIEAAQAMGASHVQIIGKVLLPEALPGLISGATVTAITLVSFTAMAGVVGAGGLGDLAIRFGYQRFQADVMLVTVLLLVLLVQLIQWIGDWLGRRVDHR